VNSLIKLRLCRLR